MEYHGHATGGFLTPEYMAYAAAKRRCNNPHNRSYRWYGARGIKFRFRSFLEFLKDVGNRPSKSHSLDRINNDAHYEKGNLRWATKKQQAQNRRKFKMTVITNFSDAELVAEIKRRKLHVL